MNRRKKITSIVIAGLIMAAGGITYSMWTATGSGPGQAKALTAVALTVNAATGTADLYPGFSGGDVYFTLTNTNPYGVNFTSMTAGAVTSSDPSGCPATNVTVASAGSLNLSVGANATAVPESIADVVSMASAAPNGCQGAIFTIALTLTGSQV